MPSTLTAERVVQLYERYGRGLPPAVSLALVIVVAWLLARLVWTLMPVPEAARWRPPPVLESRVVRPAEAPGIDKLIRAELFGRQQAPAAQRVEVAPDTRLSLTLLGILSGSEKESRALISSGNEEKPYSVGDKVVSGVTLQEIFADRVILARGGKYETLRLNKDAPSTATGTYTPSERSNRSGSGGADTAQMLSQIREEIMTDPTKASNYLRVQPQNVNGQLRGYRIYPGREREAFQQLGLRPGDLITEVNGVQLDDNQKALQLLGDLSQASAVTLTIERGGQTQTLNLSLN